MHETCPDLLGEHLVLYQGIHLLSYPVPTEGMEMMEVGTVYLPQSACSFTFMSFVFIA